MCVTGARGLQRCVELFPADSCLANPLPPVVAFSHLFVPLISCRKAHLCSQTSATHHEADLAREGMSSISA